MSKEEIDELFKIAWVARAIAVATKSLAREARNKAHAAEKAAKQAWTTAQTAAGCIPTKE